MITYLLNICGIDLGVGPVLRALLNDSKDPTGLSGISFQLSVELLPSYIFIVRSSPVH